MGLNCSNITYIIKLKLRMFSSVKLYCDIVSTISLCPTVCQQIGSSLGAFSI